MSQRIKTRALVINFIKYKETSVIVRLFTESHGLLSIIVNGVRSSKSRTPIALFQPLTLLDVVIYYQEKKELHRLNELRCTEPLLEIQSNMKKAAVILFLDEVLFQCLKVGAPDPHTFRFIHDSLLHFNIQKEGIAVFHMQFLLKFSHLMGFGSHDALQIIDIVKNSFHKGDRDKYLYKDLHRLIQSTYGDCLKITATSRSALLDLILQYFTHHVPNLLHIKSLEVLKTVYKQE